MNFKRKAKAEWERRLEKPALHRGLEGAEKLRGHTDLPFELDLGHHRTPPLVVGHRRNDRKLLLVLRWNGAERALALPKSLFSGSLPGTLLCPLGALLLHCRFSLFNIGAFETPMNINARSAGPPSCFLHTDANSFVDPGRAWE